MKQIQRSKTIWVITLAALAGTAGCGVDTVEEQGAGGNGPRGSAHERDSIAPPVQATPCAKPSDCPGGFCVDGVCCNAACSGICQACTAAKKGDGVDGTCGSIGSGLDPDNECAGTCNGLGACSKGAILLGLGGDCSLASECASGFCVDGVCCNASCTAVCQACTAAVKGGGVDGTCENIAPNTDPQNECAAGNCNGLGACGAPPGASPNGSACASGNTCSSGYCVDGVCCDSACSGTCQACSTSKKGSGSNGTCGNIASATDPDNECALGTCNGSGACGAAALDGLGVSCSNHAQCASGACVDGYCCNTLCTEACKTCNVAGSVGTCTEASPGACSLSACTGTIGLPTAPVIPTGAQPQAMVVGDFDGNGRVDMAIARGTSSGALDVMLAFGNGVYATSSYALFAPPKCIATGDFNGDMLPDLAASNCPGTGSNAAASVSVLLNQGNGTFTPALTSALPTYTTHIAAGDVNGDNKDDLVITENTGVRVYTSNGTAAFGVHVAYGVGMGTKLVSIGDLDGNGFKDLVVTSQNSNQLRVFLNQGAGTFGPWVDYPTGTNPRSVAIEDLDGNGSRDLAVANWSSPTLSVFFNTGNGTFSPKVDFDGGSNGAALLASDINGDGRRDLIMLNYNPDAVSLLFNLGGGNFAPRVTHSTSQAMTLGAGDFNGDNQRDLVLLNATNLEDISMLYNQGNGVFTSRTTIAVDANATSPLAADIDNNGTSDVVINNENSSTVSVLLNQGNAVFAPRSDVSIFAPVKYMDAVDLSGDGFLDLAVLDYNNQISVRLNQGNGTFGAPANYSQPVLNSRFLHSGDFNGDGKRDLVIDASAINVGVLLNTGNGSLAPRVDYPIGETGYYVSSLEVGDFNGDGRSDIAAGTDHGNVRVLLNQGNGTFGAPMTYPMGSSTVFHLLANDLDQDGFVDLVAADFLDYTFSVLRNLGNGSFTKDSTYSLGQRPRGFAAADVDRDGIKDLVVAYGSQSASRVRLFRGLGSNIFTDAGNYPTTPNVLYTIATADFDGDTWPDFATVGDSRGKLDILLTRCLP